MSFTAPHIGFVLAAYGLSAVCILALIIKVVGTARRNDARLRTLESEGAPRRKASGKSAQ